MARPEKEETLAEFSTHWATSKFFLSFLKKVLNLTIGKGDLTEGGQGWVGWWAWQGAICLFSIFMIRLTCPSLICFGYSAKIPNSDLSRGWQTLNSRFCLYVDLFSNPRVCSKTVIWQVPECGCECSRRPSSASLSGSLLSTRIWHWIGARHSIQGWVNYFRLVYWISS